MEVKIQRGKISGTTRAPPYGRLKVSGEACAEGGLFIGQWELDSDYAGYFTGGLEHFAILCSHIGPPSPSSSRSGLG